MPKPKINWQDMNLNFWNDGNAMARTNGDATSNGGMGVYASKHVESRYHIDTWPRLKPGARTKTSFA